MRVHNAFENAVGLWCDLSIPLRKRNGSEHHRHPGRASLGRRLYCVGEHVRALHHWLHAAMQSASFAGEVVLVLNQEQRCSLRIDSHILFPLGRTSRERWYAASTAPIGPATRNEAADKESVGILS